MGKKSTPTPPDYAAAAEQTAQGSREAARDQTYANRIDQSNPWGNLNYESYLDVDPASGKQVTRWRQNQTLSPEIQAALDSQLALQQGRSDLAGGMMGDLQEDYGERMNFDQFGDPIGMGEQGRLSGAGQGINTDMGLPGKFNANVRDQFAFDDPGLQGQNLENNLDYSGAPDVNSPEWTRQAAEQSVYDRGASRLDPQIAQEQQALDVKLRSQGLNPGDEAYTAQMTNFEQRKTDAYDALQAQSMQEGARQAESMFGMESQFRDQATGEEDRMKDFRNQSFLDQFGMDKEMQGQLFDIAHQTGMFGQNADTASLQAMLGARGQDVQGAIAQGALGLQGQQQGWNQLRQQLGYNTDQDYRENALSNQLRTQGMNEAQQQRAYRLNEVNALLNGQQVQAPNFNQYSQQSMAQGADYLGAAGTQYEADMAKFGADQAMMNSLLSGLGMAGGMMAGSDRRLKRNIVKIAEINGTNWYEFDYIWGDHAIGVMADEVPHAAITHPSGYLMVDYSKI